jgi:4-oxalomesaconate tautomerase
MTHLNPSTTLPVSLVRGGTSKGLVFCFQELQNTLQNTPHLPPFPTDWYFMHHPENPSDNAGTSVQHAWRCWRLWEPILLKLVGSPDPQNKQIQGLGGGSSTTNKIAFIRKSQTPGVDIDFLFIQAQPKLNSLDISVNCGNFISMVTTFAVHKNIVPYQTSFVIENTNTKQQIVSTFDPNTITIPGVVGAYPTIFLEFHQVLGSHTGKLFPTNCALQTHENIDYSIVDICVPMIIIDGHMLQTQLQINPAFSHLSFLSATTYHHPAVLAYLQQFRIQVGTQAGFTNLQASVVPKMCVVFPHDKPHTITSFYFDPFVLHDTHAVSGGMCLAGAMSVPGTVPHKYANLDPSTIIPNVWQTMNLIHQAGVLEVGILYTATHNNTNTLTATRFARTAAILLEGSAFIQL